MKPLPSLAGWLALFSVGCAEQRPVVRACMAVIGAEAARAAEQCRCIDDVARAQLDRTAYAALEKAAVAAAIEGQRSTASGALASGETMTRFVTSLDTTERAIAVADAALVAVKIAARCG